MAPLLSRSAPQWPSLANLHEKMSAAIPAKLPTDDNLLGFPMLSGDIQAELTLG
jgi:hypothetical protein